MWGGGGRVDWVARCYRAVTAAVTAKDAAAFLDQFTSDAWIRLGNADPVVGREALTAWLNEFFGSFSAVEHDFGGVWSDGAAVIVDGTHTFTRLDGIRLSLPAVMICRMDGAHVRRAQLYLDLAPLSMPEVPESLRRAAESCAA